MRSQLALRTLQVLAQTFLAGGACALEPETFFFEHPSADGAEVRRFEARIDRPEQDQANGYGVMLVGGGSVTDMDWTAPGSYEQDGQTTQLTISGEPSYDARTIGDALADAGFVVMRWSSIHADDELAAKSPGMATGIPFVYSVELTRAARDAFRLRAPEARDRLILLGHSLGAPRATAATDEGVVGLVWLAGAYTSRTLERPSSLCRGVGAVLRDHDADADGSLSRGESPESVGSAFDSIDADASGLISDWELAAHMRAAGEIGDAEQREFRPRVPWPSDVIRDRGLPTLAVFGGLDPISVHGPWLESYKNAHRLDGLSVEYWPRLGHQLSEDRNNLFGPIDVRVVNRIVDWCDSVANGAASQP